MTTKTKETAVESSIARATAGAMARRPRSRARDAVAKRVTVEQLHAYYGANHAVKGLDLEFAPNEVTAIIGPSGCGKSTMVRCINRMHEEIPGARADGHVLLDDEDVYGDGVDVVSVRRTVGMVFQKPNPFPTMSVCSTASSTRSTDSQTRSSPPSACVSSRASSWRKWSRGGRTISRTSRSRTARCARRAGW